MVTDWQPGDPLYAKPIHEWNARPMIQVLDDPVSTRADSARWPEPWPNEDLGEQA